MNTEPGSAKPGRMRLIAARVLTILAVLVAFVGMLRCRWWRAAEDLTVRLDPHGLAA